MKLYFISPADKELIDAFNFYEVMENFPIDPDERVIEILDSVGSDLSKKHRVDFYLYFPSILSAFIVAFLLAEIGFEVDVNPSAGRKTEWLCLVTINIVPEEETLHQIREHFEIITEMLDGNYDGWETMVMD
ncbi:ribonuclease E inhibitor RraB [bacterium]|nr:ribonuclease E inhibitor RraB [bacterium]